MTLLQRIVTLHFRGKVILLWKRKSKKIIPLNLSIHMM